MVKIKEQSEIPADVANAVQRSKTVRAQSEPSIFFLLYRNKSSHFFVKKFKVGFHSVSCDLYSTFYSKTFITGEKTNIAHFTI